ncbi:hypothetical protein BLA29_007471, partial [Euroglyphus maynei]
MLPYRYHNFGNLPLNTFLEGLDARQPTISNFIHPQSDHLHHHQNHQSQQQQLRQNLNSPDPNNNTTHRISPKTKSSSSNPQHIFGTSVAFPGNPLQSAAAAAAAAGQGIQNQNFHSQHQTANRLNQMQQHSSAAGQQQQAVLLPLEINPGQTRNLVSANNSNSSPNSTSSGANVITSNSAAAVAAAVAVAHPQYTQYITSWPCPACKVAFRSANELQTHL